MVAKIRKTNIGDVRSAFSEDIDLLNFRNSNVKLGSERSLRPTNERVKSSQSLDFNTKKNENSKNGT